MQSRDRTGDTLPLCNKPFREIKRTPHPPRICRSRHNPRVQILGSDVLPLKLRGDLGAFYTPCPVHRLFDQVEELRCRMAHILDPATGAGPFLFQAIRRIIDAQTDCEPAFLLAQLDTRLTSFEIHPYAAGIAQGRSRFC